MKVYLSGPMRGIPHFNFPAFEAAAKMLRDKGYKVYSPAERDIEKYGAGLALDNDKGDEELAAIRHGFSLKDALVTDLTWICQHADAIALLPGWAHSKGSRAEKATAEALGLDVIYLRENGDCK